MAVRTSTLPDSATESSLQYQHVERRAWTIMVCGFVAFCAALAAIGYGIRWFIFESEVTQSVSVTLISGTVFFTAPGASFPSTIVQSANDLAETTRIDTESGSQAAVSFNSPDTTRSLGSIQIYGDSTLALDTFRSPRFDFSQKPYRMAIHMQRGRARVNLAVDVMHPITISLDTPHGEVVLERSGSYSIEVTDQATDVVVRDGAATVSANGQNIILAPNERTEIKPNIDLSVQTGERNLVINGDFSTPLSPADWSGSQNRKDNTDVQGKSEITVETGLSAIHFLRPGRDWGRVAISQKINRDVRDYLSLKLHLALKIADQNVLVCGTFGSECPVMVDLEYTDLVGNRQHWLQGFYYLPDNTNQLPVLCVTCASVPKLNNIKVQKDVWFSYDSPDLIALFNKPTIINSITVYAEGHVVDSFVSEIELQAGD